MRFLVDATLSPDVAGILNKAGHDAVHVGEVLPLDAADATIFDAAMEQERVVVTADTGFGEILARRQATTPRWCCSGPPAAVGPQTARSCS